jgi:uncharacterized membrane protein
LGGFFGTNQPADNGLPDLEMKRLGFHFRRYIFRGFLALIPITLSVLAVNFLYRTIDERLHVLLERFLGIWFPGMGILLTVVALYLVGLIASNIIGRQFFRLIDRIADRIPLIRTTQKIGRQLADTLLLPEKQVFQKAVLVPYLKSGIWTLGFVTGKLKDMENKDECILKVFIPTPPNPLSGTMVLVKESMTRDPGWTIEEAVKTVLSGGIISPPALGDRENWPAQINNNNNHNLP